MLSHHVPILLQPITDFLIEGLKNLPDTAVPGVILDCTLGGGGHASAILTEMQKDPRLMKHCVLGVDRDPDAIARDQVKFSAELSRGSLEIAHGSFSDALKFVAGRPIYGLLADLGISSDQIDSQTRGFSFRYAAPLDMRMNTSIGVSLADYLATVSESELADVIWKYGEERMSRKIARRLTDLRSRGESPKDTLQLAEVIWQIFPPAQRYKGMHPATRTFQALRIVVNRELEELETLCASIFPAVAARGHIAILSFHSLEDRPVKQALRNQELYELPSRKAIQASDDEVDENSRSRSAKLRLAIRK
jgi:16S rRNA (cytosine1402-N4)-methyltransferase